ncbi:MAG TPA: hypothetical protein VMV25_13375 [Steroidobacteraceae bacterium]|nr:hypothetical protein [Steroidobacteraceae bacterium]
MMTNNGACDKSTTPQAGACPKWSMTFEPKIPSLDEDAKPKLVSVRQRLPLTLPLTVVVTMLAMADHHQHGLLILSSRYPPAPVEFLVHASALIQPMMTALPLCHCDISAACEY